MRTVDIFREADLCRNVSAFCCSTEKISSSPYTPTYVYELDIALRLDGSALTDKLDRVGRTQDLPQF